MTKRCLILLILSLMVSGCSLFISNPEIVVRDMELAGLGGGGITLDFHLAVRNPNAYDLKLNGYRYDLNIDGINIARNAVRSEINFPGNAVTDVKLPVRIGLNHLLELMKRRTDPDNVPYRLSAGFDLETAVGTITIPLEKSGSFAIPKEYRPGYYLRKLTDFIEQGNCK